MESKPVRVQALFAKQMVLKVWESCSLLSAIKYIMSRTFRRPSQNRWMGFKNLKKVKDGTPTKVSHFCENNGGCPYCEGNRLHKHKKQITINQELTLFNEEEYWMFFEEW
jgi:hypothetical protein